MFLNNENYQIVKDEKINVVKMIGKIAVYILLVGRVIVVDLL